MKKYCFGIDIGGTTVKCGLFTTTGELKHKWEITTRKENNGENILPDVAASIKDAMEKHGITADDTEGIGMGVPGPVCADGTVLKCANLGWGIINAADIMEKLTGLKTAVGNDANVAALGEMWCGAAKGFSNVVMVTLGTGVGGGIIVDGKIVCGSNGAGGEIGHIIVNPHDNAVCGCGGHGHLEQYASATGIVRMGKILLDSADIPSKLRDIPEITAKDIFDCAKDGDEAALKLVDELGKYLGTALSHVSAVVNPEVFVIGGGVSKAGTIITDAVEKYYNSNILFALKDKKFIIAGLGNDAGIYGSAKLILS